MLSTGGVADSNGFCRKVGLSLIYFQQSAVLYPYSGGIILNLDGANTFKLQLCAIFIRNQARQFVVSDGIGLRWIVPGNRPDFYLAV